MEEHETSNTYETENIRPLFEQTMFFARQRYPRDPEQSFAVVDEIARLAREGKHIALVDGSFDVPQPNHQWYLHHCRLIAGKNHAIDTSKSIAGAEALAACDDVVLVVSLDTDEKLAALKGHRPEKGGVPKPVYPWQLRAQYISNFMTPTGGKYRPVVDIVTIDGHAKEHGTPHESHLALGAALLERNALHSWIFYGEHDRTKQAAEDLVIRSGQQNCRVIGIIEHMNYSVDADGEPWASSSIIKKIRGV